MHPSKLGTSGKAFDFGVDKTEVLERRVKVFDPTEAQKSASPKI